MLINQNQFLVKFCFLIFTFSYYATVNHPNVLNFILRLIQITCNLYLIPWNHFSWYTIWYFAMRHCKEIVPNVLFFISSRDIAEGVIYHSKQCLLYAGIGSDFSLASGPKLNFFLSNWNILILRASEIL